MEARQWQANREYGIKMKRKTDDEGKGLGGQRVEKD